MVVDIVMNMNQPLDYLREPKDVIGMTEKILGIGDNTGKPNELFSLVVQDIFDLSSG